jgi:excisionase family DNA binding protein
MQSEAQRGRDSETDLKVSEVAEVLRTSQKTVRSLIGKGKLPAYTIGERGMRIRPEDLDEFRKERLVSPAKANRQ